MISKRDLGFPNRILWWDRNMFSFFLQQGLYFWVYKKLRKTVWNILYQCSCFMAWFTFPKFRRKKNMQRTFHVISIRSVVSIDSVFYKYVVVCYIDNIFQRIKLSNHEEEKCLLVEIIEFCSVSKGCKIYTPSRTWYKGHKQDSFA